MIDIIIPAYNCNPKTFQRCLKSILSQTIYNKTQITIIDDCSTDNSYLSFLNNYPEIKILYTKENCGPGEARQFGLNNTFNEYIVFIDSDDELYGPNSLEILYRGLMTSPTNVMCSGRFDQIIDPEGDCFIINHPHEIGWLFGKIYKRSYLEKYSITFPTNYSWSNEDNGFNILCTLIADDITETIVFIPDVVYNWMENKDSITHDRSYVYEKDLEGYVENVIWALMKVLKIHPKGTEKIFVYIISCMMHLYQQYVETLARKPYLAKTNLALCQKFYQKIYCLIEAQIPQEQFIEIYNLRIQNIYNQRLWNFIPTITIHDFLALIKEEETNAFSSRA